ncbi:MAG: hypothetical protein WC838_03390 [Candidatus Margulisiibacteriota bacterium]|jgi:hypothetical protein
MEISILIGALSILAYNLAAPVLQMRLSGKDADFTVNKYYGDELGGTLDFARINVKTDSFGTFQIQPRLITTYCGDAHWQKINNYRSIH